MIHHVIRILYIQHISFGDILVSTSVIRKLKEKHTNSVIDYYTTSACLSLLISNPDIHQIFTERNPPKQLEKYDIVLRPYRCLQETPFWHRSGKHSTDLLAEVCGVDLQGDYRLFFYNVQDNNPITEEKVIVIQCKTNDDAKDWSRFPELVELINKKLKLKVVQVGSINDPGIPGVIDVRGKTSWPVTAKLIKDAFVTICLDSITQHIAGAIGAPYICLYGAKNPRMVQSGIVDGKLFSPPGVYQAYIEPPHRNVGCFDACNLAVCQKGNKCIDNIDPVQIISEIERNILRI